MEKFVLDEAKAREWLARNLEKAERREVTDLDFDASYDPRSMYSMPSTHCLLNCAQEERVITGPGTIAFTYDEEETDYSWILDLDGPGDLRLSTLFLDVRNLGSGALPGVPAAVSVLREAVDAANQMLDSLDAYAASRAAQK